MLKDTDVVVAVCPDCGNEAQHEIGWLKAHPVFRCACGSALENDPIELVRVMNANSPHPLLSIRMQRSRFEE